jgi:hypothetical protein
MPSENDSDAPHDQKRVEKAEGEYRSRAPMGEVAFLNTNSLRKDRKFCKRAILREKKEHFCKRHMT